MAIAGQKKIISVVGASSGCGATFVAVNLAAAMAASAEGVTFMEDNSCGCDRCQKKPLIYYEKELFKNIPPRRFVDFFFEKATGRRTDNRLNHYKGVNWVVRTPESPIWHLQPEDVGGRYIIWDNNEDFDNSDLIICVINPQTAHLMAGLNTIRRCRQDYPSGTVILFNQVTSEAAVKRAEKLVGSKGDFYIPAGCGDSAAVFKELAEHILTLF